MYVAGIAGRNVYEYALGTAFDVSTASFDTSFSVFTQDTAPTDLAFDNDGTKMYVSGSSGENVNEYALSTAFDVSSASFITSFSVAVQVVFPQGLAFDNDGTKMYVVGFDGAAVYEYDLSSNAFIEKANDGSVEGSLIVSITGDRFTNAGGALTSPTHFTLGSLPSGLVPSMSVGSDSLTATLTLSGNATSHADANDVSDLQFTFTDAAFTDGSASAISNAVGASSNLGIDFSDTIITNVSDRQPGIPKTYALHQNYPNPFNPVTTITYDLVRSSKVELTIYNVMGQKVRMLFSQTQTAGFKRVTWDGKNDAGNAIASGVYIYRLQAGQFIRSRKLLFLK